MADLKIFNQNNTVIIAGKPFPAGTLSAASNGTQNITITRTDNSKVVVKDVPYNKIVDKDGTAWGANANATVTALNNYINASDPDGILTTNSKVTDLTGVTSSDFVAIKPGYGVFSGTVDGSLQTSGNFLLHTNGVTVDGDLFFAGTGGTLKTSSVGSIAFAPTGGDLNLNPTQQFGQGGNISFYNGEYTFPTADGSNGQVLQTDGSGALSFATVSSGDVLSDTSPQLGGDLDLNGSNITGTGNINTTGTLTTSGTATLPGILLGSTGILGTGGISTSGSISTTGSGGITSAGTLNVAGNATFSSNLYASNLQFVGSGTNVIGPSNTGGSQDDLQIESNGNVTIVLDDDDNETDQAFKIESGDGTLIWQVNESGVTSGLLTTVTPTLSGAQSSYQQGSSATLTISNHVSGRSYQGAIYNSSGVEQTSNAVTIDSSGNVSFNAPSTIATGYELRIFSADVGKLRSAEVTATFEVTASRNFSYWRLHVVNSSGTQVEDKVYLLEIDFYTGANATGTVYPTAAVASSGSGGGATITSGYFHSATYADWKAFDNSTGSGWWTLGLNNLAGSNEDLNWIQMELTGGAQTIQSVRVRSNTTFTDGDYLQILGSNTGNFTGEEILCGTLSGIATTSDVTQNI